MSQDILFSNVYCPMPFLYCVVQLHFVLLECFIVLSKDIFCCKKCILSKNCYCVFKWHFYLLECFVLCKMMKMYYCLWITWPDYICCDLQVKAFTYLIFWTYFSFCQLNGFVHMHVDCLKHSNNTKTDWLDICLGSSI